MTGPGSDAGPGAGPGATPPVVLLTDARVVAVPVHEDATALVDSAGVLPFDGREDDGTGAGRWLRRTVLERLADAAAALPGDLRLVLNEGYRRPERQRAAFDRYRATLAAAHPELDAAVLRVLASRYISPPELAPHTAGAAADVLLTTPEGVELDLGCPIDATPEQSGGRCYTDHPDVVGEALLLRRELVRALHGVGLVNYPTEWWHWSFGDRYWAWTTGAAAAVHGPVPPPT
ncbi:M15 family metallopeptidase [Nocardioides sp.]|uniref:M15 family metallopeptidase n=1 Tax=Nocardioides sp. TaxID=35761 RepID=UPI003513F6A8